ncbi:hypothetical protein, partial [Vibrio sp. 10N.222.46.A1]
MSASAGFLRHNYDESSQMETVMEHDSQKPNLANSSDLMSNPDSTSHLDLTKKPDLENHSFNSGQQAHNLDNSWHSIPTKRSFIVL